MPALTPTQKQTLRILRHAGVLTYRQLADRLGVRQETARSRLNRLAEAGGARKIPNFQMERAGRHGGSAFYWYEPVEP